MNLKNIYGLENFNTQNVETMFEMFYMCSKLESLDLSSFNTKNVTNMSEMFFGCRSLTTIYVGEYLNTQKVSRSSSMFGSCFNLKGQNGTTFSSDHVDKEYARIDGENGLPGYFSRKE